MVQEERFMNDLLILLPIFGGLIAIAFAVFMIAALWKMFVKAGQPGWGAIIPIYNTYILLLIADKPGWWLVLYLIPVASFIVSIIVSFAIAEKFGKTGGFAIGMILLPVVFIPILGFGSAKYMAADEQAVAGIA